MTKDEFTKDWKHFCNHIDFGRSNLDAKSIRFMNEGPGKIIQTIEQRDDLLDACKLGLNSMRGLLEIGVEIGASNKNKRKQAEDIRQVETAIAKCEA